MSKNSEDLFDSDGSEWLEELTQKLTVNSPLNTPVTTPRKAQKTQNTSSRTVKAPVASANEGVSQSVVRVQGSPSRAPKTSPILKKSTPRFPRVPRPNDLKLVWISSSDDEPNDEPETETETDSSEASSLFDNRPGPSRETTVSSVASFPAPARRDRDFLSLPTVTVPKPVFNPNITVSLPQSFGLPSPVSDDPFMSTSVITPSASEVSSPLSFTDVLPSTAPTVSGFNTSQIFPNGEDLHMMRYIIVHDAKTQELFDKPGALVPWGTQFELSRGVLSKKWTWEKVREKVKYFSGKSDEETLHTVGYVMTDRAPPKICRSDIGQEYDREQIAILENRERGLGLMDGLFHGVDKWFGGQIQQTASLMFRNESQKLYFQLHPPEMRRSTRFARKFGSRRVLQIRIHADLLRGDTKKRVMKFLNQKFVLNGRVFAPTPPKESTVYLVEVAEDFERIPRQDLGDSHRMSLGEVLDWHNPMGLNAKQPITKYAARAALALSNTVPALIFEVQNIHFIEDIVAEDNEDPKPKAAKVLTDGCGLINKAALLAIAAALNYPSMPTAVQGRIAGSKGLWTIYPDDKHTSSDTPQIWIRDSQRKIAYPHFNSIPNYASDPPARHYKSLERAHRIFDLCHSALPSLSMTGPMFSLKGQSVLNLWSNGIATETFKDLMEKGLQELIEPLIRWDTQQFGMVALWDAVNKIGKVSHTRTVRLAATKARALGLVGRDYGKDDADDSTDGGYELASTAAASRNEVSGAPFNIYETTLELIQAGFHPARDEILWSSLQKILELALKGAIEKLSIPLPEGSAVQAFVIPDPLGVLKENEIYYRSSIPLKDPTTQTLFNVVTGEVLIGRYPLRVRTDIQKVVAVDIPELEKYKDVIIVPVKPSCDPVLGMVSLMSKCAGGDLDGDELFLIWLKVLVNSFQPLPSVVLPPEDLSINFESEVENLDAFFTRAEQITTPAAQSALIEILLGGLTDSSVGMYDWFHDKAYRTYGYDSPEAIRLAFLFNELLDAPKTGKKLLPTVHDSDNKVGTRLKNALEKQDKSSSTFVFDVLEVFSEKLLKASLEKFNALPKSIPKSSVLLEPYIVAQQLCQTSTVSAAAATNISETSTYISPDSVAKALSVARRSDLRLIERHVDQAYQMFCSKAGSSHDYSSQYPSQTKKKKSKPDLMSEVIVFYAEDIPGLSGTFQNVDEIKASYAYHKGRTFYFAKTVAFRSLCERQVKASSESGAPSLRLFDEMKSLSGGAKRLLQS
ncbi:RNA dependent RNA polymerase-domain-containing protein [Rhodocollybia butyracea]|uniref:RNA-dependent RNA polymerase n=1 Tax=Rhodocollybia butyracea TaxID=206335 RepID=A0A9P5U2K5_9AGAR|nr:RNA dependent RNA polymerase-domain-containing protein [Rhodocollybia butyracea]